MKFKNQDAIIAVVRDKLIIISFDGGKTWKVQSLFNFSRKKYYTIPNLYIFKGKYLRMLGNYLCFFSSNDTGITWLPPKKLIVDFKNNRELLSTYPWGLGTFINESVIFAYVAYFNSPNFIFTKDGGNTFHLDTNPIGHFNFITYPQLVKFKDEYFLITSGKLQVKGNWLIKNFFRKIQFSESKVIYEDVRIDTTMQFIFIYNCNDTIYAVIQKELDE